MNLAYIAGLVDGEGCIGFTKCRNTLIPRIIITNTNRELIELLQEQFGGCIRSGKRIKTNWKDAYHWVVTNRLAMNFLCKVERYLILKSEQALCLLAYDVIRPGKSFKWTQEGKEARQLLLDQIHWLNKKGIHNDEEPIKKILNAIAYSEAREGKKRKKK